MKAKVVRGNGFRGCLSYVCGKAGAEPVCGTLAGDTLDEMCTEIGAVRRLRPEASRPVWHCSLSLPPGERMDAQDWRHLTALFLARMEIDPDSMQWIAVRHHDAAHDHVHIVANRVRLDGSLWSNSNDVYRAIDITQQLETDFNLQKTPGRGEKKSHYSPTSSERRMMARTGERSAKSTVAATLNKILKSGALSRIDFETACKNAGIEPRANLSKSGKMSGYSFSLDGHAFPGSKVGWGWKKLSHALGEAEKSHSEVARDLKSAIFAALESGKFHSEIVKKGWSINGNRIFSSCGQTIDLTEWGIDAREIDHAAEIIRTPLAAHRRRSEGVLPPDLETYAALAVMCPGVLAALVAIDALIRIGEITEEHRRTARREAWKKVHEIAAHIEEEKTNGRSAENTASDRGVAETALAGRGAEDERSPGADRDHDGTLERPVSTVGDAGIGGMSEDIPDSGECAVPPGGRERHDTAPLQDDHRSPEDRDPAPRTGALPHALDCDPDRMSDLAALAAHLASLADAPVSAPAPEAPIECPDPLPEIEEGIDVEEEPEEEVEESDAWMWGR